MTIYERPFDQVLFTYCIHQDVTIRKISTLADYIGYKLDEYGGFTSLQCLTIRSFLNTLKHRIEKMENNKKLMDRFNYHFEQFYEDIENAMNEIKSKKSENN